MKSFITSILVVSSFALASETAIAAGRAGEATVQRPVTKPAPYVADFNIGW